jgi:hypothetical protein
MQADAAEVATEARLHKRACSGVDRLAWRAENIVNDRRRCDRSDNTPLRFALELLLLLLALFAFATAFFAGAFSLQGLRRARGHDAGFGWTGHAHDVLGHLVGLRFEGVVR